VNTFEKVLADFEKRLAQAEFVAIDTELTGVDIEGEIDTFEESAGVRLDKICRVAERYGLIQIGLTLVSRPENGHEGRVSLSSYNFFAFPYVSYENGIRRDPVFMCQATALRFNAQHRVDFNTWINQGIPYMTREDEREMKAAGAKEEELKPKVGLLRLWKSLCNARLPFVVHCPLDLFFLLVAFERRPLPRNDPRALAVLIRKCTPKVYDTAHLHGAVGRFRRLGLAKFLEDAKARHAELSQTGGDDIAPVEVELQGETAVRYSKPAEEMAHEAGYDSLMTAQLFLYLRAISPMRIREAANRLFLYRSIEFVDIERAALEGVVGCSMFDLSRVTLLVAALDPLDGGIMANEAARLISAAGAEYKWMDSAHILVVLRASGGTAIRKASELASKVHGVESWMPFEQWREMQALECRRQVRSNGHVTEAIGNGSSNGSAQVTAVSNGTNGSMPRTPSASPTSTPHKQNGDAVPAVVPLALQRKMDRERWIYFLRGVGASGVLFLLALIRLHRRWRSR